MKAIEQLMQQGIDRGIFPAASLLIGTPNQILFDQHFGQAREGTCFDIASLTKAVSTATLCMQFYAEDLIKMGDTLFQWLGGARQPFHKEVSVEYLLCHKGGFPAWQAYYRELPLDMVGTEEARQRIRNACLEEPPFFRPGAQCVYSDLGYILLGEILAEVGIVSLDVLFQHRIAIPLSLKDTFFVRNMGNPIKPTQKRGYTTATQHVPTGEGNAETVSRTKSRRFAPTEDCPWRERVVHGEVHDQNAYAMGGVAGHAGLFSTTKDLHRFISELVQCYHGKSDWIPAEIVQTFLDYPHKPGEFVLGWDTPKAKGSLAGQYFSVKTIGHLGYSGCSMWIDLAKNFWVILLTNRIHPNATNEKIRAFRPRLHDLIAKELTSENN